eukprot:2347520-Rhodomonas_salina.2
MLLQGTLEGACRGSQCGSTRLKQLNRELEDRDFPKRFSALRPRVRSNISRADMTCGVRRTICPMKKMQYRSAARFATRNPPHAILTLACCNTRFGRYSSRSSNRPVGKLCYLPLHAQRAREG